MLAPWVIEEAKNVDFKDKRLNERFTGLLSELGSHPSKSIPACYGGGAAEVTAAYRFFDNDKVCFENVLQSHVEGTRRRVAEHEIVILAQDTTELDLTRPDQQVVGAGPLDGGRRRGVFLHPLHAFTPDGTPLGTLRADVWAREEAAPSPAKTPAEKRKELLARPIEEKESYRWIETMQCASEEAQRATETHFVCVSDSEADIYELLADAQQSPQNMDWIVRACQNRRLQGNSEKSQENIESQQPAANFMCERVEQEPVLFTHTVSVRGRKPKVGCDKRKRRQARTSRKAVMEVRAAQVTLRPPKRPDRCLPEVTVNVVLAREIDPPAGEEPVEWILLTPLPIDSVEDVRKVLQYYTVRWLIEVFFRTLKSGCRVEDRRFETLDRYLPCLALYLIITWRTLFVCRLGREFPDMDCEALFEPAEWKSVWTVVRRQPLPDKPPKLQEMVRMVAQLGGYVNRKRTDEPGPQTVWIGMQRLHDIALCWQLFGPEARIDEALV
jgi:hypothetical protein